MVRTRNTAAAVLAGALVATAGSVVGTAPPAAAAAPDGLIAFERLVEYTDAEGFPRRTNDIFTSGVGGTGAVNVTASDAVDDIEPAWSPDGTRIAFSSNRDGNYDLWTMTADGTDLQQVTFTYGVEYEGGYVDLYSSFEPTWSPDGTQLAFTGYRGASLQAEVFVVDVGQSETTYAETQVTDSADSMNAAQPDWSPDGQTLLYDQYFDQYSTDIWTIGVDGTGATNLTEGAGVYVTDLDPSWSPDGTWVTWVSNRDATDWMGVETDVYVMQADGTGVVRATADPDVEYDPEFSPDGTRLLYQRNYYEPEIWVVDAPPAPVAGARAAVGPALVGAGGAPSWQPVAPGPPVPLTVTRVGRGAVTSSPAGIDCGRDCAQGYAAGTRVTLTATPAAGKAFAGWSGACTGTRPCRVTLRKAKGVSATFVPAYAVGVSRTGPGRVTSAPAGIRCGADCTEAYARGTTLTLTATPNAGKVFTGWTGACSGTGPCTVSVRGARSVGAAFR